MSKYIHNTILKGYSRVKKIYTRGFFKRGTLGESQALFLYSSFERFYQWGVSKNKGNYYFFFFIFYISIYIVNIYMMPF